MIDISLLKTIPVKDENRRTPLLCVTESTVSFGIGALEILGKPSFAKMLVDEEKRILYLVACEKDDLDSFSFVKDEKKDRYVRLKSRSLHRLCDKLSGLTSMDYPYRVDGKEDFLTNNQPVVVFEMKEARKTGKI